MDETQWCCMTKPLVPGCVSFAHRPRTFVTELQQKRLEHLLSHQRKGRSKKDPTKQPGESKPRRTKLADQNAAMLQMLMDLAKKGTT